MISGSVGGRAASGWRAGGRFEKQKTENKRGPGGPGPPLGVENTPKGAKEAARGSSIRWEQEGWRLGSALNKGFQVLDQYWCRHTSPHEVSGAQCLSRRLILAVFEFVFVFRLGGPTPSEAAGGRPLTERSKTLGHTLTLSVVHYKYHKSCMYAMSRSHTGGCTVSTHGTPPLREERDGPRAHSLCVHTALAFSLRGRRCETR